MMLDKMSTMILDSNSRSGGGGMVVLFYGPGHCAHNACILALAVNITGMKGALHNPIYY